MTTTSTGIITEAYEQLADSLRGDLITPADPPYDPGNTFHINQNIQPASGAHPVGRTGRARPTLRGRAHLAVELPM